MRAFYWLTPGRYKCLGWCNPPQGLALQVTSNNGDNNDQTAYGRYCARYVHGYLYLQVNLHDFIHDYRPGRPGLNFFEGLVKPVACNYGRQRGGAALSIVIGRWQRTSASNAAFSPCRRCRAAKSFLLQRRSSNSALVFLSIQCA